MGGSGEPEYLTAKTQRRKEHQGMSLFFFCLGFGQLRPAPSHPGSTLW